MHYTNHNFANIQLHTSFQVWILVIKRILEGSAMPCQRRYPKYSHTLIRNCIISTFSIWKSGRKNWNWIGPSSWTSFGHGTWVGPRGNKMDATVQISIYKTSNRFPVLNSFHISTKTIPYIVKPLTFFPFY